MTNKILPIALLASLSLVACEQEDHTIEVGGPADPQAAELAAAEPIDPATVPMRLGGDDYRCSGSNQIIQIDWIKTGEQMSARVTPAGESGVTVIQGDDGAYVNDAGATLSGGPDANTVTFNGTSCKK